MFQHLFKSIATDSRRRRSSVVAKKFAILCNSAQQTKSLTPAATAPQVETLASLGGGERRSETVANLAAEETPRRPNDVHRSSKGERERRGRHTRGPSINDVGPLSYPLFVPNGACRSTNSKLVLQKVKGQTVQGQTAQEF